MSLQLQLVEVLAGQNWIPNGALHDRMDNERGLVGHPILIAQGCHDKSAKIRVVPQKLREPPEHFDPRQSPAQAGISPTESQIPIETPMEILDGFPSCLGSNGNPRWIPLLSI